MCICEDDQIRFWREVVQIDCQAHKLNRSDAMDCSCWRQLLKDG